METLEGNKKFTKPITVCVLALISCFLWGSAFPCVKIGYELFEISASDTASVLLFAGLRFSLAGILVITFGSIIERRVLLPKKSSLWKIFLLCLAQTVVQYAFFLCGTFSNDGRKSFNYRSDECFCRYRCCGIHLSAREIHVFKSGWLYAGNGGNRCR